MKAAYKKRHIPTLAILIALLAVSGVAGYYFVRNRALAATFTTSVSGLPEAKNTETVSLKDGQTYELKATPVKRSIDGKEVRLLGYNGMVPGPTIQVPQGASIKLKLTNQLDVATTLHPHGVNGDNKSDGLPGITQSQIEQGQTFTQTIRFPDKGVYWYHPHIREDYTQASGLYGNFIVKPKSGADWPVVSREQTLVLSDIALNDSGILPFNKTKADHTLMGRFGTVQLVNGKDNYKDTVKTGDVVRYYVTNTASTRVFRLAIANAKLKLAGADNGQYEQEKFVDSVTLGPAERAIVDVYYPKEGSYTIQNATPNQTYILGTVNATPGTPTHPEVADVFAVAQSHPDVTASITPYLNRLSSATKKRLAIKLDMDMSLMHESGGMSMNGSMMDMGGMNMSSGEATNDGIEWTDTMEAMNAKSNTNSVKWQLQDLDTGKTDFNWTFKKGELVNLTVSNSATVMHPMQHPIHIHGQRFLVVAIDGVPQTNLVWKDTVLIPAGKTYTLAVVMDNPGKWMIHCHIPEHLESGMMGTFTVSK
jgi:FtsP/CotA-like multicopper oxidase with cupredoxin domain